MTLNCQYCNKQFSSKGNLSIHQNTAKYCLEKQGKILNSKFSCEYCDKVFTLKKNLNDHASVCKEKPVVELKDNFEKREKELTDNFEKEIEKLKVEHQKMMESQHKEMSKEIEQLNKTIVKLEDKLAKYENKIFDMASRPNTNNKIIINNIPLTNDVIRQCANTFTLDNARTIGGITKHLTTSLEEHITCTDPSRSIFKYVNEKDEEIVDKDLEILLPQYLSAIKDKNNFLHKEMAEYFKKNNVSIDVQTDYQYFYGALNSIIEKNGHSSKFTEKCKQYMVRECKKQFLDKNKNKEKEITKKLTEEEIMMMVIEEGGSVHDFVEKVFEDYDMDTETDAQFERRRHLEDVFREKKREWRLKNM
jgi:hypothetical protein